MKYKEIVKKVSIPAQSKTKQKEYLSSGTLPIIDQGKFLIGGYSNDVDNELECELPVIVFGDHTKCVKYINFPFVPGADGIKVLKPKEGIYPKYLFYYTQYLTYRIEDKGYARHYQYIEKEDVLLPPLPEQERIVSRIEGLFSELDNAVETLNATKKQLDVYRQAVLKDAFRNCQSWERHTFADLMETVRNGYGKKPSDKGNYKILKISAVRALHLDFEEHRYNEFQLSDDDSISENDILFTRYNGSRELVGVCTVVPKLHEKIGYPDKIIKCTPILRSAIHSKYLSFYMSQGDAKKYLRSKIKTTSGQNGIAGSDIKNTIVYVPDLAVQKKIVEGIESCLSVCESIEKTVDSALSQASAMRQSILKQAFEGGLQ